MRIVYFQPPCFPKKKGAEEEGWGQVGSSHLNEKYSFEWEKSPFRDTGTMEEEDR